MRNTFKIERRITNILHALDIPVHGIRREKKWALSSLIYLNDAREYKNKQYILILYNDDLDEYPIILRNVATDFKEEFSVSWDLSNIKDVDFFIKNNIKKLQN